MDDHEGDEDAEEEEDEHGVLHELDVVRVVEALVHPRSPTEGVVVVEELAACQHVLASRSHWAQLSRSQAWKWRWEIFTFWELATGLNGSYSSAHQQKVTSRKHSSIPAIRLALPPCTYIRIIQVAL